VETGYMSLLSIEPAVDLAAEKFGFCAGFWTPATTKLSAHSASRRPKSVEARSRGEFGAGWAATAMGI
jgi:hypothetical protein